MRSSIICLLTLPAALAASNWQSPPDQLAYNQVCFLAAHNAYANKAEGWHLYRQQNWSIQEQLAHGVRALMLDTFLYDDHLALCHGGTSCIFAFQRSFKEGLSALAGKKVPYTPLAEVLKQLKQWLDENPQEVLTLFFEHYADNESLAADLHAAELSHLILHPKEWNPRDKKGWPTLGWMREHNKRVVVFNENKGHHPLSCEHPFWYQWEHLIESSHGALNFNKVRKERAESAHMANNERTLFLLNYFSRITSSQSRSTKNNDPAQLGALIHYCKQHQLADGRLPNFLALDFVDQGDGLALVNDINNKKIN